MNVTEASRINLLLDYVLGVPARRADGEEHAVTEAVALDVAAWLAGRAEQALGTGLDAQRVHLYWAVRPRVQHDREGDLWIPDSTGAYWLLSDVSTPDLATLQRDGAPLRPGSHVTPLLDRPAHAPLLKEDK